MEFFPIDRRTVDSLTFMGYFKHPVCNVFIAKTKGSQLYIEGLSSQNLTHKVDSVIDRYNTSKSYQVFMNFFYLYYEFEKNTFSKNKGKLYYQCYPDFKRIPDNVRGTEVYYENSFVEFIDVNKYGDIYANICDKYLILNEEVKSKLYKGVIKVRYKK